MLVYKNSKGGRPKTGRKECTCVSVSKEIHNKIAEYALKHDLSLRQTIENAITLLIGGNNG
jgi:predicted HicB family RNase H-like nuclease